jgi:L-ascorbate metabolism protein UlaG (beta-lactamase superfamily)
LIRVHFHGHACFSLSTAQHTIVIDPWFTDNPMTNVKADEVNCDYILVSHGHFDHLGDAIDIAKRTGATIIGVAELATYCANNGVKAHGMHIGGGYRFPFGRLQLTPAWHGSSVLGENIYLGCPCGFVINLEDKYIYHAGDTGLFGDMQLIGNKFALDLALLPIGDNYVMGPEDAITATELLRPKIVVPMHYNTFDLIKQDADLFKQEVETTTGCKCHILEPGEEMTI